MPRASEDIRLADPASMQCPYANYAALHARAEGVHEQPQGWVVTGYEDVRELATNNELYSNHWHGLDAGIDMMGSSSEPYSDEVKALIAQYPHQMPNVLLVADPPVHTRHRALVLKALNARRVRATEPTIQSIVDELIDDFIDEGRCEFMSQFAGPLPGTVSAHFLGLDRDEVPRFFEWTEAFIEGFIEPIGNERRVQVARAVIEYQSRMLELIADRRREPHDDLLSDLVHAEIEEGEELDGEKVAGPRQMSDPELLAIMILLVTGGQHTTMGLLGSAMVILCEKPDVMAELRANRELIPGFIEEALRFESPIQGTVRRAKQDLDVWGARVPRGATLFPMWGAANSDPGVFANPRSFDMQRPNNRRHFAFGHGRHFCVGAALARAEARMAFETFFTRLKDIRLSASDGAGVPAAELHPSMTTRMHKHIHLEFTKS